MAFLTHEQIVEELKSDIESMNSLISVVEKMAPCIERENTLCALASIRDPKAARLKEIESLPYRIEGVR